MIKALNKNHETLQHYNENSILGFLRDIAIEKSEATTLANKKQNLRDTGANTVSDVTLSSLEKENIEKEIDADNAKTTRKTSAKTFAATLKSDYVQNQKDLLTNFVNADKNNGKGTMHAIRRAC